MSAANFPWTEGARQIGADTAFGRMELPAVFTASVDGMLDASTGPVADLVHIERAADRVAFSYTIEAMQTALAINAADVDKVFDLWRLAVSYGAAMAVSRTAARCLQVRLLAGPEEGEA